MNFHPVLVQLQFHLLPIRDWNSSERWSLSVRKVYCNFTYSLLGIETRGTTYNIELKNELQFHLLPIRDWNFPLAHPTKRANQLQFHLLPIRDWNPLPCFLWLWLWLLQFHLLPIRDWNTQGTTLTHTAYDCNFTYSLLGIETQTKILHFCNYRILQFHLLPIRDWNQS